MKIELRNEWVGNTMRDGGAFPITLISLYADIHPGYKFFNITILNFSLSIDFGGKYILEEK